MEYVYLRELIMAGGNLIRRTPKVKFLGELNVNFQKSALTFRAILK